MTQPPPDTGPPSEPQLPSAQFPPAQFPPAQFPPAQYPPAQFPPAQVPPVQPPRPPIPPGPFQGGPPPGAYAAPPLPYPGAGPTPRSTGKTIAIVLTIVLGTIALGVIVMAGACFGILSMLGA